MMRGINDQAWRADLLGDVLNSYGDWGWVHVNLIPLNPTPGLEVDRLRPGRRARVRAPARGQGHPDHGARHPRPRDRRRLRPARRGRVPELARGRTAPAAPRPPRPCRRGARAAPSPARGPARAAAATPAPSRSSTSRPTSTIGATDGLVGVVVLAGVLEDLLHGAAGAGQEHDAGVADLEQDRLAGGVAEVLRDRGGEHVGRLVAVVPGRDAERLRAVGEALARRRSAASAHAPTDGPVGRHPGQRRQRLVERRARRRPDSQAPRLAASMAPGPPPVATTWRGAEQPARAGPRRRTPASPRCSAWPPITPTRRRGPPTQRPRAPRRWRGRAAPGRAAASWSSGSCDQA